MHLLHRYQVSRQEISTIFQQVHPHTFVHVFVLYSIIASRSLEGIVDDLRSDRLVDGVSLDNLPVMFTDHDALQPAPKNKKDIHRTLPGMKDTGTVRVEMYAAAVRFSPSGREWAAATSQGIQVFTLDDALIFSPTDLDVTITPHSIDERIHNKEYGLAINMALQLGEKATLKKAVDSVPVSDISLVIKSIDQRMIKNVLTFLADEVISSRHLEFYLSWCWELLQSQGSLIRRDFVPFADSLRALIRSISLHENDIMKVTDDNSFTLSLLLLQLRNVNEIEQSMTS